MSGYIFGESIAVSVNGQDRVIPGMLLALFEMEVEKLKELLMRIDISLREFLKGKNVVKFYDKSSITYRVILAGLI